MTIDSAVSETPNTTTPPSHDLNPLSSATLPSQPQHMISLYFVIVLLLMALPFVYFPQWQAALFGVPLLSANEENVYIADLDFWRRTERETRIAAQAYFDLAHDLNDVPLDVGLWHGKTVEESNEEVMILLEPEQYVQRLYQRESGEYIWLSMIGGRSSQPFHAPDICYDADGWQYNVGSYPIQLNPPQMEDERSEQESAVRFQVMDEKTEQPALYGLWLEANKPSETGQLLEHIVFYFYLFPNETRQINDGIVLFKLTSGRHGTVEETLALHADFIRNLFSSTSLAHVVQ